MVLRARVCGTRKWRELNRNNCPYPLFLVVMGKRPQRSSRRHATPLGTTGPRVLAKCTDDDAEDKRQDARHYTNAAAFSADLHLSGVRQTRTDQRLRSVTPPCPQYRQPLQFELRVSAPRAQRRRNLNVLICLHFHETAPDKPDSTGLQCALFDVENSYRCADHSFISVARVGQRQDRAMFINVISGRRVSIQFLSTRNSWLPTSLMLVRQPIEYQGALRSPAGLEVNGQTPEAAPPTVIFLYIFVLSARMPLLQLIEFVSWHTPCLFSRRLFRRSNHTMRGHVTAGG